MRETRLYPADRIAGRVSRTAANVAAIAEQRQSETGCWSEISIIGEGLSQQGGSTICAYICLFGR